jgi:mono/diheme cytochrome c family protein
LKLAATLFAAALLLPAVRADDSLTPAEQIAEGRRLFMEETFGGNGRTCASCHVESLNFRLTPANVAQRFATLAQTFDPLFIAEPNMNLNTLTVDSAVGFPAGAVLTGTSATGQPARAKVLTGLSATTYLVHGGISPAFGPGRPVSHGGLTTNVVSIVAGDLNLLESTARMRGPSVSPDFPQGRALILENPDGFDQPHVFRKVPHLQNLLLTEEFGFDNDSNLREFTTGAVRQHFTRTMARVEGVDFRLPTAEELDHLAAFMFSLLSPADPPRTAAQRRGQAAFLSENCGGCHFDEVLGGRGEDDLAIATGVANQPINGPAPGGDGLPPELPVDPDRGGSVRDIGVPGLFNVKNNGPFFHDASAATLEAAVRFYNSQQFKEAIPSLPIDLDDAEVDDLVAFLSSLSVRGYRVEHAGVDVSREGSVHFGTFLPQAGSASRTFTVKNTSPTASLRLRSPACRIVHLDGTASPDFSAGCGSLAGVVLGPGQARNLTVTFDPASAGLKEAILEILTDEPTGVDVLGLGAPASVVDRFTEDSDFTPPGWAIPDSFFPAFRNIGGQLRMSTCRDFGSCTPPNGNILVHEFGPLPERFNYTIRAVATADPNDSNDFSVIFNYRDPGNYYYASFNERRDKAGLFKMLGGVRHKLSSFPAATPPGDESAPLHSIRVEKRGSRIRVFRGSTLYADVTNGHHRGGRAGVGTLNDSGRFDDFVITPLP